MCKEMLGDALKWYEDNNQEGESCCIDMGAITSSET